MKRIYKMALVFMVAMLAVFGPNVMPAQTATTITAEAASTSVKALTVGKSYTISGYSKVKSSKTSIATSTKKSSKKYTVKAKKKGTTTLKCYNASGKLVKTVCLITTNSSSFKYDTTAITLTKGKTKTVKATVQSGCTVKYSSSKTSVATVSSAGKITAKKAGAATISAKVYYKGKLIKTMKKNVTVKNAASTASSGSAGSSSSSGSSGSGSSGSTSGNTSGSSSGTTTTTIPTLSVTFDTAAITLSPGKTATASASVTSGYTVAYTSSNTSVATVSSSGVITGVAGGSATITATVSYSGTVYKTMTKSVTVRSYQLSSTTLTVSPGGSATLKCATSAGEYSSSDSFVWSSSNTSVATVSGSGYSATVKGVAAGTATITCKVNSKVTLTCTVTVRSFALSSSSLSIDRGSTGTLDCTSSTGTYAASDTFAWSSSDTSVATVSSSGRSVTVTGVAAGTATITCKVNGTISLTCAVTVNKVYTYHASCSPTNCSIAGGDTALIGVWCEKVDDTVIFSLSNDNVQIKELNETCYQKAEYDYANETNAYYTKIYIAGRKEGTCNINVYINGNLFKTFTIIVTSTDTYYYDYIAWKADLKEKLWTDDMSDLEKLIAFGDYVFSTQPYSDNHSPYGYAQNYGGSCWASSYLLVDLAHDLGLEAEVYTPYSYNLVHYAAKITIGSTVYGMQSTQSDSTAGLYGKVMYWIISQ